jgi:geranylgeranyl pyrophosphate synthase
MLTAESKVAGPGAANPPKISSTRSWKQLVEPVEPFLETVTQQLMRQVNGFDPQIVPYARYALDGSGKRLRPTLVALAARTLGPVNETHVTAAVIIEMVHLATLVHDDVMDEAAIRRGQLTSSARSDSRSRPRC